MWVKVANVVILATREPDWLGRAAAAQRGELVGRPAVGIVLGQRRHRQARPG